MRSKHHNKELLRLTEELEQLNLRRDQVTERIDTLLLGEQHFSDRDGTTLEIGDKVSILTPGKYSFKEGTVVKLGKEHGRKHYIKEANKFEKDLSEMSSTQDTPEQSAGTNTPTGGDSARGNNTDGGGRGDQGGRGKGNSRNSRSNGNSDLMRNFKGEEPEVGAVLGMAAEQRNNRDRFKFFQDKLLSYIKKDPGYKYVDDIVILVKKMKDPMAQLEKKRPDEAKITNSHEFNHSMKLYVERKMYLSTNITKLYSLR